MNGRADVIAYLRGLADHPDGLNHRGPLFRAALMLERDATTVFMSPRPDLVECATQQERHGDQST